MLRAYAFTIVLVCIQTVVTTNSYSQCLVAPPVPAACLGTEPATFDNEIINDGVTKWYYGAPVVFNQLTLKGGTLIVCSDLTITNFSMDSGTVYIRPGAHLKLAGGSGVVLRGKSSIYNYGTFDCTSNLSLDNTWATPSKPNIVMNVTVSSVFRMSNQYFTISSPNAFFVNRGTAEFWGLITDYLAAPGSVCLGYMSQTKMTVLYNNSKHTYTAPEGRACVHVNQYSQFKDTLTKSINVNVCLAASHVSDATCIPWGCKPNAWGTPNLFQFCTSCSTITLLPVSSTAGGNTPVSTTRRPGSTMDARIAPNPFVDQLRITWGRGEKPRFLSITNTSGALVYSQAIDSRINGELTIRMPGTLPPGGYFLKLVYSSRVQVQRLLKDATKNAR